jgi:YD repeat-containing protein
LLDAAGNVTGRKDPLGNLTQFLFDADNRQSVTIDALNNRATVLFDAASRCLGTPTFTELGDTNSYEARRRSWIVCCTRVWS